MGGSGRLLGRLKKLERAFSVDDQVILDIVMWTGDKGGLFGHAHHRYCKSTGEMAVSACSVEEEIALMKEHYEKDDHRFFGRSEVSFAEYLEGYSYLGPEGLAEERAKVVQRFRGEPVGV